MPNQQRSLPQNSISELRKLSQELKDLQNEKLKRERAKNDLLTYASIIEIPTSPVKLDDEACDQFIPAPKNFGKHHLLWLECLQKVEDGEIKNLLGMWPPGAGKSIYTSVVFPTHFMGRFRNKSIIMASYGDDLPRKAGRRARSIVRQPIYKRIFDAELSPESAAVDAWAITNGSEWMGAGILSGITGNRADGVIWDDIIKGREQADSLVIRNKTWDAYFDDLLTRKKPGAWEIGITTRWHEDDPAGRILPLNYKGESGWIKGQDGKDWYVVCLPAEAEHKDDPIGREHGERLWPEWFGPDHFTPYKHNTRTWSALYQQRPAPDTGDYFRAEWLKPYVASPPRETMHIYGASDYAVTTEGGDYTVHMVCGIDPEQNIYLLDLWRGQTSSDKWIEKFCDLVAEWKPMGWAEETGQIKASIGPFLVRALRDRQLYIARAQFPTRGDKAVRAQSIRGRMAMNGLYVPTHKPWFADFKAELMSFPAGRTDDQVDALGLIGQILDKMVAGEKMLAQLERPKILSTDPDTCTVTLTDLFEANERRKLKLTQRIH
jgi:predicted phage terminase large subunit-like protein